MSVLVSMLQQSAHGLLLEVLRRDAEGGRARHAEASQSPRCNPPVHLIMKHYATAACVDRHAWKRRPTCCPPRDGSR